MLIIPLFLSRQFVMAFLWALILGTTAVFALFIARGTRKPKSDGGR
jgi:4-amino-4-deoxy-L-arabinose transferase-like glycosyltransferase